MLYWQMGDQDPSLATFFLHQSHGCWSHHASITKVKGVPFFSTIHISSDYFDTNITFFRQKVDFLRPESPFSHLCSNVAESISAVCEMKDWMKSQWHHKQDFYQQHILRWTNSLYKEQKCRKEEFLTPCSVQCPAAHVVSEPTQKASLKCVKQMCFVVDGFVHLLV